MIDPSEAKKIFLKQALPAIVNQLGKDLKNGLITKTLDEAVQTLLNNVDQALIEAIGTLPLKDDEKAALSKTVRGDILKGIRDNQAEAIEAAAVRELFASKDGANAIVAMAQKLAAQGMIDGTAKFEKNVGDRLEIIKGLRAQNRWKSAMRNVLLENKDANKVKGEITALYDAQIGEFQKIIAIDGKSLFAQFRAIEIEIANKRVELAEYMQTPKKGPRIGGSGTEEYTLGRWQEYFGERTAEITGKTDDSEKRSKELTALMSHPLYTEAYAVYPKKLDELQKSIQKLVDEAPRKRVAAALAIGDAFKALDAQWQKGFADYVAKHQKAIDKHPELAKAVNDDQKQRAALRNDSSAAFKNLVKDGKILGLGGKKDEPVEEIEASSSKSSSTAAASGSTASKLALRRGRSKSISILPGSKDELSINGVDWSAKGKRSSYHRFIGCRSFCR